MWKWKVNFKTEARANPSMAARSPNGDLPMMAGFIVVHRRSTEAPNGHRWASWRSSAGHRRGIGRKFGHFQWKSTGGRTVSHRRPSGTRWLTLWHGSRSRKSGGELLISKNRHPAKIYWSPRDLCFLGRRPVSQAHGDGASQGLCCLMTPGLSKDIQCHVWPYFSKLANHQIRHQVTHKVGCQHGDCIWSL